MACSRISAHQKACPLVEVVAFEIVKVGVVVAFVPPHVKRIIRSKPAGITAMSIVRKPGRLAGLMRKSNSIEFTGPRLR